VFDYLAPASNAGLTWKEANALSDIELEQRLFRHVGRSEPTRQAVGFRVKALYTVIGMHHRTLRRWLARKGVPLLHVGASVAVPLVMPREAFPEVWRSVKAIGELHRGTCPVCGETVEP
jgi:hypothetical protein